MIKLWHVLAAICAVGVAAPAGARDRHQQTPGPGGDPGGGETDYRPDAAAPPGSYGDRGGGVTDSVTPDTPSYSAPMDTAADKMQMHRKEARPHQKKKAMPDTTAPAERPADNAPPR